MFFAVTGRQRRPLAFHVNCKHIYTHKNQFSSSVHQSAWTLTQSLPPGCLIRWLFNDVDSFFLAAAAVKRRTGFIKGTNRGSRSAPSIHPGRILHKLCPRWRLTAGTRAVRPAQVRSCRSSTAGSLRVFANPHCVFVFSSWKRMHGVFICSQTDRRLLEFGFRWWRGKRIRSASVCDGDSHKIKACTNRNESLWFCGWTAVTLISVMSRLVVFLSAASWGHSWGGLLSFYRFWSF